jgi:hypothetical protein
VSEGNNTKGGEVHEITKLNRQADVLDQTRLRPHFDGFCWHKDLWRLRKLFKFFEKADAPFSVMAYSKPCLHDRRA